MPRTRDPNYKTGVTCRVCGKLVEWGTILRLIRVDPDTPGYELIRWDNPDRAPLLLIGGELDLIADASMTRAIYEKQRQAPSLTELKIYPGRSHWTLLDPGWEEVADYALDWAVRNARAPRQAAQAAAPIIPAE